MLIKFDTPFISVILDIMERRTQSFFWMSYHFLTKGGLVRA